jgi:hypothetical protein
MKMHTGEKQYQCSVCGQQFIQKGSLEKHNTLCTVERLYGCGVCGKMLRCKLDLNQHTKLHTGDVHMCCVCVKVFTKHPNLYSHVQTHTREKPYLCHTSGIRFTQKEALTKHFTIHNNDLSHQCSVCNKCFITQSALNLHLGFTLLTNRTHVQHVRSLSLKEGTLCDTLWYILVKRALCVGLWEGIHWADQFEERCETAQWSETFPLSLWWEFGSETWSEKVCWKTAWSKIVIWSIQILRDATHYSITFQQTWILTTLLKSCKLFEIVLALLFYLFSLWICVKELFFAADNVHSWCAATR